MRANQLRYLMAVHDDEHKSIINASRAPWTYSRAIFSSKRRKGTPTGPVTNNPTTAIIPNGKVPFILATGYSFDIALAVRSTIVVPLGEQSVGLFRAGNAPLFRLRESNYSTPSIRSSAIPGSPRDFRNETMQQQRPFSLAAVSTIWCHQKLINSVLHKITAKVYGCAWAIKIFATAFIYPKPELGKYCIRSEAWSDVQLRSASEEL